MRLAQITGIKTPGNFTNYRTLPTDIISKFLTYAIIAAGLLFFVKLLSAGFGFLTSAGDQGKIQSATKDLTNAAIGLIVVISSYFVIQIIQVVFGITIL